MDKNKTALEAATSLAKFMLHRLTLGVSKFSFSQAQLADMVTEAREYTDAARGSELDSKGEALYGIFSAFRVFDSIEPSPVFGSRRAPLLVEMNYSRVLEFYSIVEEQWVYALKNFTGYYHKEMGLPEGYTYRIEEGREPNVDDWIAKLPAHLLSEKPADGLIKHDMVDYKSSYQHTALEMDVLNGIQAKNGIGVSSTKAPRSLPTDIPDTLKFGYMERSRAATPLFKEGAHEALTEAARSATSDINAKVDHKESTLGDPVPVFIKISSPGEVPLYIAHQVAEFLAYRGYQSVHLKSTHSIDEVETMMRPDGKPIVHPQRGDPKWVDSNRPIFIDLNEKTKEDTRNIHRVDIRDRDPAWLPAIATHKFTDEHGGKGIVGHITDPLEDDIDNRKHEIVAALKELYPKASHEAIELFVFGQTLPIKANPYGSEAITIYMQPGEPFFVLLGRDPQSPDLVDQWASDRNQMEMGDPKVASAMNIAEMMRSYKEKNPSPGMSQNLYKEMLGKELMHLVPRTEKYTEEEILRMAMIIAEAAIMSDVALNIQNNTCFTHLGKENPVDQQIGQVAKLASDVGFYFTIVKHDDDGNPIEAWGNHKLLEQTYSQETIRGMTLYAPGEYKDMDESDLIEVPGLDN